MNPHEPARNFASDNVEGASAEVIQALAEANAGQARPYGADELTARVAAVGMLLLAKSGRPAVRGIVQSQGEASGKAA